MLAGCDMRVPPGSQNYKTTPVSVRQAALYKLTYWKISGALSIQQTGKKPEIANYDWSQLDKGYRIQVASALNLYQVEIFRTQGSVTLWKNGTQVTTAKTPENLMQNALGWSLPVHALSDWIKGVPIPQKNKLFHAQYDVYGHLTTLDQDGWTLRYGAYKTEDGYDLPQSIVMQRPGFSVNIVVKNWLLMMHPYMTPSVLP